MSGASSSMNHFLDEIRDMEVDTRQTIHDIIDKKNEMDSEDSQDPFIVSNLGVIVKKHQYWLDCLPRVKPFYAMKCNNTPEVMKIISTLGAGFDCASQGEIQQVLSIGVSPDRIIFAHPCKQQSHIKYANLYGVKMITFDSQEELEKIAHCHANATLVLRLAVDDSKAHVKLSVKFGASLETVHQLLGRALQLDLEVIGVSFHVGSRCTDGQAFRQAIEDARSVFDTADSLGIRMSLLDIGGGFPGRDGFEANFREMSAVINVALDECFPPDSGVQIIAEPGRYYVEAAFTLAVNIIAKKVIKKKKTCNVDADNEPHQVMYYVNDGRYGSLRDIDDNPLDGKISPYSHKSVGGNTVQSETLYPSVIWGPTCDCSDLISNSIFLPMMQVGDWLLFRDMGAYSICMCSNFNSYKNPDIYCISRQKLRWLSP